MIKKINFEDIVQVSLGSGLLAIPIAMTDEVLKISQNIPHFKVALIFITSIILDTFFIYYGIYEGKIQNKVKSFVSRIFINYMITALTVAYILYIFDLLVSIDLETTIIKVILISLPASMSGAVIDSFDKE